MEWPGMALRCQEHTKTCDVCQRYKKTKVKYGKLPSKMVKVIPWNTLCVDLIGPDTVNLCGG